MNYLYIGKTITKKADGSLWEIVDIEFHLDDETCYFNLDCPERIKEMGRIEGESVEYMVVASWIKSDFEAANGSVA